jgi:hypothetical protein
MEPEDNDVRLGFGNYELNVMLLPAEKKLNLQNRQEEKTPKSHHEQA